MLQKMRRQDTDLTLIILSSSDTPNVGDHDGDMSETKLTERQQKILNLIKESPTITGKQMSETLSVSQRTIERDLSAMQKIGVLKREGKDNKQDRGQVTVRVPRGAHLYIKGWNENTYSNHNIHAPDNEHPTVVW